jgi:hypothetical protein
MVAGVLWNPIIKLKSSLTCLCIYAWTRTIAAEGENRDLRPPSSTVTTMYSRQWYQLITDFSEVRRITSRSVGARLMLQDALHSRDFIYFCSPASDIYALAVSHPKLSA